MFQKINKPKIKIIKDKNGKLLTLKSYKYGHNIVKNSTLIMNIREERTWKTKNNYNQKMKNRSRGIWKTNKTSAIDQINAEVLTNLEEDGIEI